MKTRAKKLFTMGVNFFSIWDSEQGIWANEPTSKLILRYYSDGSTRYINQKLLRTERVAGRPELVVLVGIGPRQLLPNRAAVLKQDYEAYTRMVSQYKKQ
jgi:hypothetical protein